MNPGGISPKQSSDSHVPKKWYRRSPKAFFSHNSDADSIGLSLNTSQSERFQFSLPPPEYTEPSFTSVSATRSNSPFFQGLDSPKSFNAQKFPAESSHHRNHSSMARFDLIHNPMSYTEDYMPHRPLSELSYEESEDFVVQPLNLIENTQPSRIIRHVKRNLNGKMKQASIKLLMVMDGLRVNRRSVIVCGDELLWPQETIRHCSIGKIKRGIYMKRRMGICFGDSSRDVVALKIIEKELVYSHIGLDSNDIEVELATMIDLNTDGGHSSILRVFEVYETSSYVIVAMEMLGGDLLDYQLSIKDELTTQSIFQQIVSGYNFMRQKGYAHADVSLENVLIQFIPKSATVEKPRWVAKLTDFGSAVLLDENKHCIVDPSSGTGKPYYLAPEAYLVPYEVVTADIWSLGIVLFVLLAGRTPFEICNESDSSFLQFQENGFSSLEGDLINKSISNDAIDLVRSMLCLNPEERITLENVLAHPWVETIPSVG